MGIGVKIDGKAALVEEYINTAYDNVKLVADNIDDVILAPASAIAADASKVAAGISESNAATSETNAGTSETNAGTSETNAATSESNASTSETNAANDEASTAALYDLFDDRYLGAKAVEPTLDNDGNALLIGALYWLTTNDTMNVWSGTAWFDLNTDIASHLADTVDAHDASAISNVPTGNIVATTVQAAIDELDTEKVADLGDLSVTATAAELNLNDGAVLRHKVIDIGDWNMDITGTVTIAHGLTTANIRDVSIQIRNDFGTTVTPLEYNPLNTTDITGYTKVLNTLVYITRWAGGFYDFADYDSTSYNRGWITIWYVD